MCVVENAEGDVTETGETGGGGTSSSEETRDRRETMANFPFARVMN